MLDRIVHNVIIGDISKAIRLIRKNINNMQLYYVHRTAYSIIPFRTEAAYNMLTELVKLDLNPNARPEKQTLLAEAVDHDNMYATKLLLDLGGDPRLVYFGRPNCFEIAVRIGNPDMINLLSQYTKVEAGIKNVNQVVGTEKELQCV